MKKSFTLIVLLAWALRCLCQPQFDSTPVFPSSVNLFDLFEVSFTLGDTYSNPYDPDTISITATFFSPDAKTYIVNAFYYEGYSFFYYDGYENYNSTNNNGWRIRFTPNCVGTWRFHLQARDRNGITTMPYTGIRNYTFVCNSVSNANGFISKANSRYLKRDIVKNGQRQFHSFFPIGPDISWYSCKVDTLSPPYSKPYGIYEYEKFIDSLDGNANYMRIFLSQFQYLSLFGPEYTQLDNNGEPIVYFNKTVNQKDSAELDYIITYAKDHGITILPCIFNCTNLTYNDSPTSWQNNPFNNILSIPCVFFTNPDAIKITKNLIRYIVSRWGYATNIVGWELWNEVSNMIDYKLCNKRIDQDILDWHNKMAGYIAGIDPFNHCITTSMGNIDTHPHLYHAIFNNLDFVQQHEYHNIQNAASSHQLSYMLFSRTTQSLGDYQSHPFFMGEFGFGQNNTTPSYFEKDPWGIDLHNSLWSSTFSASMGPASFWWWYYLDRNGLFCRYRPILHFCENLPILSETFTPKQTGDVIGHQLVFPPDSNLETYYMINAAEDTIYGWSQDTAFAYQSLRWLTDSVYPPSHPKKYHFIDDGVFDTTGYVYTLNSSKRPQPSANSNIIEIPISNQPIGSRYKVKWYDSETGLALTVPAITYATVHLNGAGTKVVAFHFPSIIRSIQQQTITNTFGDAVFSLILNNLPRDSKTNQKL